MEYPDGFSFSVPLKVKQSKNKFFTLNLNNYRNAHHRVLNTVKRNFTDIILSMELPRVKYERVRVWYRIYPPTKRKYDLMNVVSVVDKFLMDAITKRGIIPDDNIDHVVMPKAEAMQVDRENPRVDVFIENLDAGKRKDKFLKQLVKLYGE